jgi:hypothetical protein
MYKILTAAVLSAFLFFPAPSVTVAEALTSAAMIEKARDWDGAETAYTGEVIGDILPRGSYAWINVSDGANAIGIWVPDEFARQITHIGRYGMRGDTVRVTGVFHRACPDHGGDLDIHAANLEVISAGHTVPHAVAPVKIIIAAVMTASNIVLAAFLFKRRYKRKQEECIVYQSRI